MKALSTTNTSTYTSEPTLEYDKEIFTCFKTHSSGFEDFSLFRERFNSSESILGLSVETDQTSDISAYQTSNDFTLPEDFTSNFALAGSEFDSILDQESIFEDRDQLTDLAKDFSDTASKHDLQLQKPKRRRRRSKKLKVLKEYLPKTVKKLSLRAKILRNIGKSKLVYNDMDVINSNFALKSKVKISNTNKKLSNFSNIFSSGLFLKNNEMPKENHGLLDCVKGSMLDSLNSNKSEDGDSTLTTVSKESPESIFSLIRKTQSLKRQGEQTLQNFLGILEKTEKNSRAKESNLEC